MSFDRAVTTRKSVWGMGATILWKVVLANFCILVVMISTIFFFNYKWLLWIMEVIYLSMVIAFIASPMNNRGHRDVGFYERNPEKRDPLYGLKAGLIGAAPFYLTTLVLLFMTLGFLPDYFLAYRALNAYFWPVISLVVPAGDYVIDLQWYQYLIFLLMQSAIPITCHIAYTLGLKDIILTDKILYKKQEK